MDTKSSKPLFSNGRAAGAHVLVGSIRRFLVKIYNTTTTPCQSQKTQNASSYRGFVVQGLPFLSVRPRPPGGLQNPYQVRLPLAAPTNSPHVEHFPLHRSSIPSSQLLVSFSCSARSRHSGDHLTSSRHVAAGWISHARLTNSSREAGHRSPGAIRSPGEVELRSLEWRCRPAWSRR